MPPPCAPAARWRVCINCASRLRRLEVILKVFGEEFRQEWLGDLRGRAKILSSRLGPARDLDVFITELLDVPAEEGDREAFASLRARMEEMRDKAWKQAVDCVSGADFAMLPKMSRRWPIRACRWRRIQAGAGDGAAARTSAGARAQARPQSQERRGRRLHRLRIALKKLRYTAEFLAPLYPKEKVRRYIKKLRGLQEHLGAINDIAHVRATMHGLAARDRWQAFRAGRTLCRRIGGGLVSRAPSRGSPRQALKRWKQFRAVKPFWA